MSSLQWPVLHIRSTYLYGSEAITYVKAILWEVTEPAQWVTKQPPTPPPHNRQPSPTLYGSITLPIWKRTLPVRWLNYYTYHKQKCFILTLEVACSSLTHYQLHLHTWESPGPAPLPKILKPRLLLKKTLTELADEKSSSLGPGSGADKSPPGLKNGCENQVWD